MDLLKRVIEALLFSSERPLSATECVKYLRGAAENAPEDEEAQALAKTKPEEIIECMRALLADYAAQQRGFCVVESAAGWKVVTAPQSALWVRQMFPENRPARLSPSALETLAIIAYRQPITRADIEAVRGVNVDGVMQTLLERSVVRITGRAEMPGRPLLYGTTEFFLEHFGLRTLDDLPNCEELRRVELPSAEPPEATQPTLPLGESVPDAADTNPLSEEAAAEPLPEENAQPEEEAP